MASKAKAVAIRPKQRTSAAKIKTQSNTRVLDVGAWEDEPTQDEFKDSALAWEDRQLLGTTIRFLYTVVDPRFLRRALRAGYSKQEHGELWHLFDTAAGRERDLDHAGVVGTESDPERKRLLVEVDEFENTWLPRADKIIRRKVPAESVQAFIDSFFANLSQQPLGPGVINSVSTFLDRVEQLAHSRLPGAASVLATLRERGLTEARAREMREKITALRDAPATSGHVHDAGRVQQAAEKQQKALRELRLAWSDWATTLRPLYDIREQIQLGLTEARNTGSGAAAPVSAGAASAGAEAVK